MTARDGGSLTAPSCTASELPSPSAAEREKLRVLFVGAFARSAPDGATGGVITATRGLVDSPLSDHVVWVPIDSTGGSVPPPPVYVRMVRAAVRLVRFMRVLVAGRIDVAYILTSDGSSFLEKGVMTLLARARGVPVILNPRSGLIPAEVRRSRFFRWYIPFVLRRCNRVMCQGSSWRQFYASLLGGDERLVAISNWIDPRSLPMRDYVTARAPAPVRVLYLGWVERFKGIFDLIDAARVAGEDLRDVSFVICGKGSDFDAARRYAQEVGVADLFEFRGWVTGADKAALLAEVDLYVHPSHLEGMPNSLLEAMAAGLPSIAARVGGVPDVLPEPSAGILFEPGDIAALSQALVKLVRDPARRAAMGQAARRRILEHHSVDVIWPRMLEILSAVAREKSGAPGHDRIA